MNRDNLKIRVGTRKSELAIKQTNIAIECLMEKFPNYSFDIVPLSTKGDEILNSALPLIGGKNLFTKELENALLDNSIDVIVHSLKDLATELTHGTCIGAILKRDSREDVVIMRKGNPYKTLEELPIGSVIGTSSLRRISLIKYLYPHLHVKNIRGNLHTRLRKLDNEEHKSYDAIVLAAAGIERLNWNYRISQHLPSNIWPYAVSQGVIAIQCRSNDDAIMNLLKTISNQETLMEAIMERALMRCLKGGCSVPVGVDSKVNVNKENMTIDIMLKGFIYSLNESKEPLKSSISWKIKIPNNNIANDELYLCDDILYTGSLYIDVMLEISEIGQKIADQLLMNNGLEWIYNAKESIKKMDF